MLVHWFGVSRQEHRCVNRQPRPGFKDCLAPTVLNTVRMAQGRPSPPLLVFSDLSDESDKPGLLSLHHEFLSLGQVTGIKPDKVHARH